MRDFTVLTLASSAFSAPVQFARQVYQQDSELWTKYAWLLTYIDYHSSFRDMVIKRAGMFLCSSFKG
jgi:hypothetical protein